MKKILIVGGGSAGWMSAAFFAAKKKYQVTLIESANVPIIGVGESTIPSIVDFLETIGVTEQDLFDHCSAVRKYSIQHNNWNGKNDTWWHHFCFDESEHEEQIQWMNNYTIPDKKWRWAYHLDAVKLGAVIRDKSAIPNGVIHVVDDVIHVETSNKGVEYVECVNGKHTADLYIDCTGFKALLREKLGVEYNHHPSIVNNYAVCGPGEYAEGEAPLPYTQTFRMECGWRWRISLQHRTGNGYVFNSNNLSIEDAKNEFIAKTPGLLQDKIFVVPFRNGYNPKPWKKNVVCLGLSSGFLEPLEATGLFLAHGPAQLIDQLIDDTMGSAKYNKIWSKLYKHVADFLSLHYQSSEVENNDYWKQFNKVDTVTLPKITQPIFNQYSYRNLARARGLSYS